MALIHLHKTWSFFTNRNKLIHANHCFRTWIDNLNPIEENGNTNKALIKKYKYLQKEQFRVVRIFMYCLFKDESIDIFDKEIIKIAFNQFWLTTSYEELQEYS